MRKALQRPIDDTYLGRGQRRPLMLVTRNFPPLCGGMERLNWHLAEQLAITWDVLVIGPDGSAAHAPTRVRVCDVGTQAAGPYLAKALAAAWSNAARLRPNVVLAGSGLAAPVAYAAARHCGALCGAVVHGLDLCVPNLAYRALWLPVIRRLDFLIANSTATASLAREAGVVSTPIAVVNPGVLVPEVDPGARERFRSKFAIQVGAKVLLSVGRLTARKGVLEFVRDVLPAVVKACPEALLLIVGHTPRHALYGRAQTREAIAAAARATGVAAHVRFLGKLSEQDLRDAYFAADVHVFPVRRVPGDFEGFGMVAVEAAAHGCPTVAYAVDGVVDAVCDGVSGYLVPPGNSEAFALAVLKALQGAISPSSCRTFARRFSWDRFGQHLRRTLDLLCPPTGCPTL